MVGVTICRLLEPKPRFDVKIDKFYGGDNHLSLGVNKDFRCIICNREGGRIFEKKRHGFSVLAITTISYQINQEDISPEIIIYLTRDLRLILVAHDLIEFQPQILVSISLLSDPQIHEAYLSTSAFTPANSTPTSTIPTSATVLQTLKHPESGFSVVAEVMPSFLVVVRFDSVLPEHPSVSTSQSYIEVLGSFATVIKPDTPKNKLGAHGDFRTPVDDDDDDSLESIESSIPRREDFPEIQEMLESCECQSVSALNSGYSPTSHLRLTNVIENGLYLIKKDSFSIELDGPDESLNLFNCKRSKRRNKWRIADVICLYGPELKMVVVLRKIFQIMSPGFLIPSRLISFSIDQNLKLRPLDRERLLPWDTNKISLIWNFKQPDCSRTPGEILDPPLNPERHPAALQDRLWAFSEESIHILNNPLHPDFFIQKEEVVIIFNFVLYNLSQTAENNQEVWNIVTSVICNEIVDRVSFVGNTTGKFYRFYPCLNERIRLGRDIFAVTPLTILIQRLTEHDFPAFPILLVFRASKNSIVIRAISDRRLEVTLDTNRVIDGIVIDRITVDRNVIDELANYIASGSPVVPKETTSIEYCTTSMEYCTTSIENCGTVKSSNSENWLDLNFDRKRYWQIDHSEPLRKSTCLPLDQEITRDLVVNERKNACILLEVADPLSKKREIRIHEYLKHVEVASAKDLHIDGVSSIWCVEHHDYDALVVVSTESMDHAAIGKSEIFGIRGLEDIWGTKLSDSGLIDEENYTLDIAYFDNRLIQVTPNEIRFDTESIIFEESVFAVEAHISALGIAIRFEDNLVKIWHFRDNLNLEEWAIGELRCVSISLQDRFLLALEVQNNRLKVFDISTGETLHIWAPIPTSDDAEFPPFVDVNRNSHSVTSSASSFKSVALVEADFNYFTIGVFLENKMVGVYQRIASRLCLMTTYKSGNKEIQRDPGLRPRVFKRNPGEYLILPLGYPRKPLMIIHDEMKMKIFEMRDDSEFEFYDHLSSVAPMWCDPQRFYMVTRNGDLGLIRISSEFQNKWPCHSTVLIPDCGNIQSSKFSLLASHVSVVLREPIKNLKTEILKCNETKYKSWVRLANTGEGIHEDIKLDMEEEVALTTVLLDYGGLALVAIGTTVIGQAKGPRGRLHLRQVENTSKTFSKYCLTSAVTVIGKFVPMANQSRNFIYYASGSRLHLQVKSEKSYKCLSGSFGGCELQYSRHRRLILRGEIYHY